MCKQVNEIRAVFLSVNQISHTYRDKELYIIKRLYELSRGGKKFCEDGFAGESQFEKPTFECKPWQIGQFPTDPELIASVFCALLDNS